MNGRVMYLAGRLDAVHHLLALVQSFAGDGECFGDLQRHAKQPEESLMRAPQKALDGGFPDGAPVGQEERFVRA
jgi:hypothetical protein